MKRLLFPIILVLHLLGCRHPAPTALTPLLPGDALEKWWIINSVSTDREGQKWHQSMLVTWQPGGENSFATAYASGWNSVEEVARTGVRHTATPLSGHGNEFPAYLIMPGADSIDGDWYWSLGKQHMKRQVFLQPNGRDALTAYKSRLMFSSNDLIPLQSIANEPVVTAARPVWFEEKIISPARVKSNGVLFVRTIENGQSLLNLTRQGRVIWFDLGFSDRFLTLLLHVKPSGVATILAAGAWDAAGNFQPSAEMPAVDPAANVWQSERSGKSYPLCWSVTSNSAAGKYLIKPVVEDQEISANKNSLWLGAVKITDATTGKILGRGNMIIL